MFVKTKYFRILFQEDLVCDKEIWVANAEMIFYGGMLVGSLASGIVADR